jgi:hypothetical protein
MLSPSTRIQTSPAIKTPAQLQKIRQPETAPLYSWLFNYSSLKTDISKHHTEPVALILDKEFREYGEKNVGDSMLCSIFGEK